MVSWIKKFNQKRKDKKTALAIGGFFISDDWQKRLKAIESNPLKVSCTILQPELIRQNDVLIFSISSQQLFSSEQLDAAKVIIREGCEQLGFKNEIVVINNTELEIVRSLI